MLVLRASDVEKALRPEVAVQAVKEAFVSLSAKQVQQPKRTVMTVKGDWWAVMQSASDNAFVTKVVNVIPRNAARNKPVVNAVVILMDPVNGSPLALLEGSTLTAIRTAAASVLSTEIAYGRNVEVLGVIGAGTEARYHLKLALKYLKVGKVLITARKSHFALAKEFGAEAVDLETLLKSSDVIYATTTSKEPVVLGKLLKEDFHVSSIGAHTPDSRELDDDVIKRARTYLVDSIEAVSEEAGDYIEPKKKGILPQVYELGEVIARGIKVERPSIFKSVGTSAQDNFSALYAYKEALRLGLGTELPFP